MSNEERKKTVVIRGVEEEAYRELADLAKRMRMNVGTVASQAFKLFVSVVDESEELMLVPVNIVRKMKEMAPRPLRKIVPTVIRHIGKLSVSKADLYSVDSPIVFLGINELIFEDDVTEKDFRNRVLRIINCRVVEIPKHISKFAVLRKARFIGEIRVRS